MYGADGLNLCYALPGQPGEVVRKRPDTMDVGFKTGWKLPKKSRNTKAVLTEEQRRAAELPPGVPTFLNIDAPPSLLPAKHWCDITGLEGPYRTAGGLRFHDKDVYEIVRNLGPGIDQEYLKVRSAHLVLR